MLDGRWGSRQTVGCTLMLIERVAQQVDLPKTIGQWNPCWQIECQRYHTNRCRCCLVGIRHGRHPPHLLGRCNCFVFLVTQFSSSRQVDSVFNGSLSYSLAVKTATPSWSGQGSLRSPAKSTLGEKQRARPDHRLNASDAYILDMSHVLMHCIGTISVNLRWSILSWGIILYRKRYGGTFIMEIIEQICGDLASLISSEELKRLGEKYHIVYKR